jgi:hypothetical protein
MSPTRATVAAMDDHGRDGDRMLSVQLDVHLARRPVTGRLRSGQGVDERFVGWLGFVDALKRVERAIEKRPHRQTNEEQR